MIQGFESVLESLEAHKLGTRKVFAGTLKVRQSSDSFTSVAWANYYAETPVDNTAIGGGGISPVTCVHHLYQVGESWAPRPDDNFVDAAGATWLITSVTTRLNGDPGYAVHDAQCSHV